MKKKWKILLLGAAAVIIVGSVAAYVYTAGPLGGSVLATVNDEKISVNTFQKELDTLESAARDLVKEDPGKLLDVMINRSLLLQQAKREGFTAPGEESGKAPGAQDSETATIMAYIDKKMAELPPVTAEHIDRIYEAHKEQMGGREKGEAVIFIRQLLEQQRQAEEVEKLIGDLRKSATIDINEKLLKKLTAVPPGMETQSEEDFRKALAGGKPMVVDFGSNSCIPCRQLRPVLQKIRRDCDGRLQVLIIDIRNTQTLADEYQIQVIPTVVFFDPSGKEVFRHQGFMGEEQVKEQLRKMGIG